MDGIQFIPLTVSQKHRLDTNGNRIWTKQEINTMHNNLILHDGLRKIYDRRCRVPDCQFVIGPEKENFALPDFHNVCEICYHMYYALTNIMLRNTRYFANLHDQWKRDHDDPKRGDRLGL